MHGLLCAAADALNDAVAGPAPAAAAAAIGDCLDTNVCASDPTAGAAGTELLLLLLFLGCWLLLLLLLLLPPLLLALQPVQRHTVPV